MSYAPLALRLEICVSRALVMLSCAALGGCFLDPGACRYEHRTLVLDGPLAAEAAPPAGSVQATVSLNETRNSGADFRVLNLVLQGALAGDIAGAELQDAGTEPGTVLAAWPGQPWNPNLDLATAAPSHELLADLAGAGRLRLVVRLLVPGSTETVQGLLHVTEDGDWMHPRCD